MITKLSALLFAASLSWGTANAQSVEEDWHNDEFELEAETLADEEIAERDDRQQWNRWVCQAYAQGYYRSFWGVSYYFQAGSGEGQQARSLAHLSALRNCQFRTGRQCFSRLETDCYVQRY